MKRLLAGSFFLNCLLFCVLHWGGIATLAARGGGGSPLGNGDVNGDGVYNLSDAVHLLNWLFKGGLPPTPIDGAPTEKSAVLPSTGQSHCYDLNGAEIECTQAACNGQDGAYEAGCPREDRFVDGADGTVTDRCTGLMWQRQTADVNLDGRLGDEDLLQWCDGLHYCESLTLAGHDDWRLPNVMELISSC